jgi:hypothetical protein
MENNILDYVDRFEIVSDDLLKIDTPDVDEAILLSELMTNVSAELFDELHKRVAAREAVKKAGAPFAKTPHPGPVFAELFGSLRSMQDHVNEAAYVGARGVGRTPRDHATDVMSYMKETLPKRPGGPLDPTPLPEVTAEMREKIEARVDKDRLLDKHRTIIKNADDEIQMLRDDVAFLTADIKAKAAQIDELKALNRKTYATKVAIEQELAAEVDKTVDATQTVRNAIALIESKHAKLVDANDTINEQGATITKQAYEISALQNTVRDRDATIERLRKELDGYKSF